MSQAKVDKYKEYKANKKDIIKKEKNKRRLEYGVIALIAAAFIGWIGYGIGVEAVDRIQNGEASYTTIDVTELNDFISTVSE